MGIVHSSQTAFSEDIFFRAEKEGEKDYVAKKTAKINKSICHKFWYIPPSLQPLQFWFMFCCTVI